MCSSLNSVFSAMQGSVHICYVCTSFNIKHLVKEPHRKHRKRRIDNIEECDEPLVVNSLWKEGERGCELLNCSPSATFQN